MDGWMDGWLLSRLGNFEWEKRVGGCVGEKG